MLGILLAHLVGDYLIQSHWAAAEKTSKWLPAIIHGVTYGIPYLFVTQSPVALSIIVLTHIVIDRYRLVRYIIWLKNFIAPRSHWRTWDECKATGYPPEVPAWLAVWLMIIADNTLHLLINTGAIWIFG